MNNRLIANIHSPMLIVRSEDLYQVSRFWFLIGLVEQMVEKIVYFRDLATELVKQ